MNPASTGVGLYITKSHILAHNGTVTATSEGVGKGSTFTLEIPLLN
ncbi:HAMP domain-containing histidine kinase [Patescibacteria group bacterium]|nr:MAG: HAMP domain-containing histidine kinase [Patescibacteria group bacterium]